MPTHWKEKLAEECFETVTNDSGSNFLTGEYLPKGKFPIVDQGQVPVAGYTNDPKRVFTQPLPIIVFGDHTCVFKFVDFPFAVGADGTKLLKARAGIDPQFLYQALTALVLPNNGYSRHFSVLRKMRVPSPSLPEQRRIAAILSEADAAITCNESVIRQAHHLRRTAVSATFSGLKTYPWPIRSIGSMVTLIRKPVAVRVDASYREIGIRSHGKGIFHKEPVFGSRLGNKRVFHIEPDCLILNIVFAWENAVAVTTAEERSMIASHRFPMFRPDPAVLELEYLRHIIQSPRGVELLRSVSPGGAGRNKTLNQSDFLGLRIPVPSLQVQRKIISVFDEIDNSIRTEEIQLNARKRARRELARRLLTGELRVKV